MPQSRQVEFVKVRKVEVRKEKEEGIVIIITYFYSYH